jgi:ankyrin repeat protein
MPIPRSLETILQSTSDALFPAELGKARVEIDSTGCQGDTPLHVLIWRQDSEGALALIRNGAPVDAVGEMGETPLHVALTMNNRTLVRALLDAGARVDIVSEFRQTACQKAKDLGIRLLDDRNE